MGTLISKWTSSQEIWWQRGTLHNKRVNYQEDNYPKSWRAQNEAKIDKTKSGKQTTSELVDFNILFPVIDRTENQQRSRRLEQQ